MIAELPRFTVSEINGYIKRLFDTDSLMQSVMITGEISNLSNHYRTGHLYFSLKDEAAAIKAVMFNRQAARLRFVPENGMKVTVIGRISAYERDGVYQIYVDVMQPDGAGSLAVAFEQLKKKLSEEGLFDQSRKRNLPPFPKRIGVITSPTGAAVQDIFNILGRRYPLADIVFEPVSVQGVSAPSEMIRALEKLGRRNIVDLIIIGRGGGSVEDLWCFNDELLARAVAACPVPVISAVGHETDFTICDFAADLRAPTPSAAAELAVPDIKTLMLNTASLTDRLYGSINQRISAERRKLDMLLSVRNFSEPGSFFNSEKDKVSNLSLRLIRAEENRLSHEKVALSGLTASLEGLNPLSVLLRGYAAVSANGKICTGTGGLEKGSRITVSMSDGELFCEVLEKRVKNNG